MPADLLVDTSAWIRSFRERNHGALQEFLRQALAEDRVVTCPIVIMELLQGCKNEKELERLKSFLGILPLNDFGRDSWELANELGSVLRRRGLAIPTIDILLASLAKNNSLSLLHHDRHFEQIKGVVSFQTVAFL